MLTYYTKHEAREFVRFLNTLAAQARTAVIKGDFVELSQLLDEIDGTSAQLREYADFPRGDYTH